MALPAEQSIFSGYGSSAVLTPDGSRIAYILRTGGHTSLEVQALDQWEGTSLVAGEARERPYQPFFSPDGRWLAYHSMESGAAEVYVRPLNGRGKWQISSQVETA